MATAVIRQNMTLGHQNMHSMMPNMSMLVAAAGQTPVIMHHSHHMGHLNHNHHTKRPLAPAPQNSNDHQRSSTAMTSLDLNQQRQLQPKAVKPKLSFQHVVSYTAQPASVQRRNARERNRVKQVNNGFANLRQHIPSEVITALTNGGRGASKKLSKVDTLKLAVEYIRRLQDLLDDTENDAASTSVLSVANSSASSFYSTSGSNSSPMEHSLIPTCSETSASPAPSYTSEVSSSAHLSSSQNFVQTQPPYKFEPYDGYNPEDEELLDCISWWQQQ